MNERRVLILAGLAVLATYLACLAPGVFWRDSSEFVFLGHQLDIGHPAGSPTFSLLTKALSFVPLGSLAWRANLFSALAATAAVLLLWLATARWVRLLGLASPSLAFAFGACAGLSFAFSASFWAWSEVAEVYAGQAAMLAGLLWLTAAAIESRLDPRLVGTLGLVLGLSCGMHMVQILYAPAFGLALVWAPPFRIRWRTGITLVLFFFIGFAVYAYLPVRAATNPIYNYGNPVTWPAFLAHITGRQYGGIVHHFPWSAIFHNLWLLAGHVVEELNPLLALAVVVGLVAFASRQVRGFALFALLLLGHLYLYVKDWSKAFGYIPVFLLCAWVGAVGLAWIWRLIAARLNTAAARSAVLWVGALAVLMGAWGSTRHLGQCDLSAHDLTYRHGRAILSSLPEAAVLVGYQDHLAYNTFYQQLIEKWRPDVTFIHRAWLPFPAEIERRFPQLRLDGYRPDEPFSAQAMLLANAGSAGAFWDYGWEMQPWIDQARLRPHGLVYQVAPQAWDGAAVPADEGLWADVFWPIVASPLVSPRGYDWTAQEIYARAFHLRAKIHADAGRWTQAVHEEERAVVVRPDFAEGRAFLGLALLADRRPAQARAEIDRAVRLDPLCVLCRDAAGQVCRQLGDRQGALVAWRAAFYLDGTNTDIALRLTRLLLEEQVWEEAQQVAEQALPTAVQQGDWVALHLFAARAAIGRSHCDLARPHLRAVAPVAANHPGWQPLLNACGFKPGADL